MTFRSLADRAAAVAAGAIQSIDQLNQHASTCELCRLCTDRRAVVTGSGPLDAAVMVVCDVPGYHDDRVGRLLSGRASEAFDDVLAIAGVARADVYLTSVVKCRPPAGRTPLPDEVETCQGWLFHEIALVRPEVVVTFGSRVLGIVTGRHGSLDQLHGGLVHAQVQGRDVAVWPLFHPAAAVHQSSLLSALHADARGLRSLLQGARATAAAPASSPAGTLEERDDPRSQLTLDV